MARRGLDKKPNKLIEMPDGSQKLVSYEENQSLELVAHIKDNVLPANLKYVIDEFGIDFTGLLEDV